MVSASVHPTPSIALAAIRFKLRASMAVAMTIITDPFP
jgi:hypothetical protein